MRLVKKLSQNAMFWSHFLHHFNKTNVDCIAESTFESAGNDQYIILNRSSLRFKEGIFTQRNLQTNSVTECFFKTFM